MKIDTLQKERDDALALASMRQAEADTWKMRYEELKQQRVESSSMSSPLLSTMKQELVQFLGTRSACPGVDPDVSDGSQRHSKIVHLQHASSSIQKFRAFMTWLPTTAIPSSLKQESHVVFKSATKLPLLSKAAMKAW